ncbi:hypothetical protein [Caviibacterium pharyngocola]|uniref:Uncharacterized protein n=1 Tax=Caviibacterium pharyngocola TaxID=28159 RepID=A0A2M8RWS0_9PAST|nr:hypothetical protein [Caviibacterium pharyngocola]PJG83340.1 hypothetical protein CVP04_04245 [Caviibacterium pharyngocola]
MPIPKQLIETCPNCNWKADFINKTDCIVAVKICPKCGEKTQMKALSDFSLLEQLQLKLKNW